MSIGRLSLLWNCPILAVAFQPKGWNSDFSMPARLKSFLQQWLISTLAVLVVTETHLVKGIHCDTASSLLAATLLLGILNTFVRPLLTFLSLPLLILTLGLFRVVINALLLLLVNRLVEQFHVDSFGAAFWGALTISIVSMLLNLMTGTGEAKIKFQRGKRPTDGKKPDGGNGPVIDV
jgi:putative membrane protein